MLESKKWKLKGEALHSKLYLSIKELIINGSIPFETRLPPSRILAKDLSISRSTVLKAFDLLSFERFISSKKGSGYYVSFRVKKKELKNENLSLKYPSISKRARLFEKYNPDVIDNFSKKNIAFRPGLPPLDIFPVQTWKNLSNKYWRNATPTSLSYAPSEGLTDLRVSISNYLKIYRNLDCDFQQVIITSGSLHALYLVGNAIIDNSDKVVMENPTYPRAHNLFKSLNAEIIPCEIDSKGLMIDSIKNTNAKLIYTTPSNQYPLGVKMTKKRRVELLKWASKNNSLIIEDDYDHEFSNWEKPKPSLFSLDKENRVIYQGTFNKLLHPSLRIGYLILPKYLLKPVKSIYEQSSRFVNLSNQIILNNFIKKDYLNRHIRNVINVSLKRKLLFIELTKSSLKINSNKSGLHVIGELKNKFDDKKIHKILLKNDVVAFPLSNYYITKEQRNGIVLGYSSVNEKVMKDKTLILNYILNS
ncbi:PLP-dependent aminotransferase family protein [Polaribacter porphyrae]|uniref:HTH gntR-type domain-containing protein n=1 Tax=Polaribacter porphyrae TaxID=1137780 RepID=A0A2S7WQ33_9FLAO|nr:PLP-dependent aminotransferase family protein [Polaribacter porphyrae]PQJ79709.1 hypothetical protein BTO18_11230 [Polaribacter porphyrae]